MGEMLLGSTTRQGQGGVCAEAVCGEDRHGTLCPGHYALSVDLVNTRAFCPPDWAQLNETFF